MKKIFVEKNKQIFKIKSRKMSFFCEIKGKCRKNCEIIEKFLNKNKQKRENPQNFAIFYGKQKRIFL